MTENKLQLEDWLDDLCVRFIINIPNEDLASVERICFQVEEAQWFYEDFIRPLDPALPSMNLRTFCMRIFQHCPLLSSFSTDHHMRAFENFMEYKTRVPVRGAILLNEAMDSTLLVKGWKKGASWSFPRGKINKDEDDLDCAIREVDEETGFDIKVAGLVPKHDEVKYIEFTMHGQQIRLYVFRDVPMDTVFAPKTRKEISNIQWFKLSELPAFRKKGGNQQNDAAAASNANKFYMVAPFLVPLKKWIVQQKRKDAAKAASNLHLPVQPLVEEVLTEEETATQTDVPTGPSASVPSIDTYEGATRELQRLLKMQPAAAQGHQQESAVSNGAVQDKGGALMAMLQSKGPTGKQPAPLGNSEIPHTPFDHIQTNPPEPQSPHHHHPTQRLSQDYYQQPPPNFPVVQRTGQNLHHGYQNQPAPISHAHPNNYNQTYTHRQAYTQNMPQMPQFRQPRKEPVLLHPQPLPPQVQQSVLTRGILPTPQLQEMAGIASGGSGAGNGPFGNQPNQYDQGAPRVQQRPVNMPPPQMTSHAMSLLNAFKSGATRNPDQHQAPNGQRQVPGAGGTAVQPQYQAPPAAPPFINGSQGGQRQYQPQNLPSIPAVANLYQQVDGAAKQPSPRSGVTLGQPAQNPNPQQAAHRSALLDIFKKQTPLSPTSSSDATVRPSRAENERPTHVAETSRAGTQQQQPQADAMGVHPRSDVGLTGMNPELNLPFRATQILARPKQAENIASQGHSGPSTQIRGTVSPQNLNVSYNNRPYPAAQSSPNTTAFPAASMLAGRQESNLEQRQKLLSLFGSKAQPSPTALWADDKGKQQEVLNEQPRSRVASLSGEGMQAVPLAPRRASGTPISPSDRDFLLNFLKKQAS
ncbi:Mrna decapping complex subunit 2 [Coniochaeta hoffmannii]|uniref:Mrna decapping complex subunit 2 n=1 Tax=Coniochaeta hoffmannii TaxID=91930 RepID=A0AA38VI91_9PEZI|nr:Mrna decapping complex subunit 2 [Coniochaeta hoffmannii]